jgi:hypothetical protein
MYLTQEISSLVSMHRPAKEAGARYRYRWYNAIASEELNSLQMRWSSCTSSAGSKR